MAPARDDTLCFRFCTVRQLMVPTRGCGLPLTLISRSRSDTLWFHVATTFPSRHSLPPQRSKSVTGFRRPGPGRGLPPLRSKSVTGSRRPGGRTGPSGGAFQARQRVPGTGAGPGPPASAFQERHRKPAPVGPGLGHPPGERSKSVTRIGGRGRAKLPGAGKIFG